MFWKKEIMERICELEAQLDYAFGLITKLDKSLKRTKTTKNGKNNDK